LKLNVENFKEIIKRGTLNYIIESIGIKVSPERVKTNMISSDRNVVLFINKPNDIIEGITDEVALNFTEPNNKVKPYLDVLDENLVPLTISDSRIRINKELTINFDDESVINVFGKDNPKSEFEFFHEFSIDESFMVSFDKIKKIGRKFEKIYFTIEDKKLYIETTDKTNAYSNGVKLFICNVEYENMSLCFKYKNFIGLMKLISTDDFSIKFSYTKASKLGLIAIFNKDESERYFLMSILDS
jgi:hypothetical protein